MQHPAFVRKTYDETMGMMVEARNYLTHAPQARHHCGDGLDGLKHSCEAMRVTARLTSVMAWLLMQRAVVEGEIEEDRTLAGEPWLGEDAVCLDKRDSENLPTGLMNLLDRSFLLYVRVARIEASLRSDEFTSRESRRAELLL